MKVAVIGAGIGGLTSALALLEQGFEVEVFEQVPRFSHVGAGIQVSPNATMVLARLGLLEALERFACRPLHWRSYSCRGGPPTVEVPLGAAVVDAFGAPYLHLHRGDLHRVLAEAVPASTLRLGKSFLGLDQDDEGVVARFSDGSSSRADVVVGADGVHSRVREALFGPEEPRFDHRVAYRGIVAASRLAHLGLELEAAKWWGPDRHFVHYFVSGGEGVNFVAVVPADDWRLESWLTRGDVSEALQAFAGFHPTVLGILGCADEVYKWALYDRDPLPAWSAGRVTLLGDACHAMLPFMAQGAAAAMEDAVILARCLAEVDLRSVPAALGRYETARRPRAVRLQEDSRSNDYLRDPAPEGPPSLDWLFGYDAWAEPLPDVPG